MMNRTVRLAVSTALGLALAGLAGSAMAQDNAAPPAEGTPPAGGEAAAPPAATAPPAAATVASGGATDVTLHQGGIGIDGDVVIGLSKGNAGKPINIVPNLYYGVSNELTVGLAHNPGAEVFQTAGTGLCLSGTSGGCDKVYNNLSLDALFSFMRSSTMDLAAHGGLDFLQLSPDVLLSLRVGVKGKTMAGPLVIVFDPSLNIGLTNRDPVNKEYLQIPVRVGFLATPQLNLGLSVAFIALIDPPSGFSVGDLYQVPVGIGGTFAINNMLDVRAQFSLDQLGSASAQLLGGGRADARTLSIGAAYRM
jgi:hypothetical protein